MFVISGLCSGLIHLSYRNNESFTEEKKAFEECIGSVVECLTLYRGVVGLSLTGDTALCS